MLFNECRAVYLSNLKNGELVSVKQNRNTFKRKNNSLSKHFRQ